MTTEREALQGAIEALESIALAGMSGTGQESEEGMQRWHARRAWEFIAIAARALEPARAALAAASTPSAEPADPTVGDHRDQDGRPGRGAQPWLIPERLP